MNSYLKIILSLSLSGLSLFASHNQASGINKIESQALAKLTLQLRTNIPANIKPELDHLDEIATQQAQEKIDSLQAATNIFSAAALGALFTKATSSSLPQIRVPYRNISDDAIESAAAETTKFLTGFEIPAALAMIPSAQTLLYGGLALGGLFTLYQINRAIHAPCKAKFTLAEHKWGHQLKLIREHTEKTIAKHEQLNHHHQETLVGLQESHSDLGTSLDLIQTEITTIKSSQIQANNRMKFLGESLLEIQGFLQSMQQKAHWDLNKFRERAAAAEGLKEQQANMLRSQEIDMTIRSLEQERKSRESNGSAATYITSTGQQRSFRPAQQTQTTRAVDNGSGVGFIRNPISQAPIARTVDKVGCFGCFASGVVKKSTELR
jgi:hypothetical protein